MTKIRKFEFTFGQTHEIETHDIAYIFHFCHRFYILHRARVQIILSIYNIKQL